MLMNLYDGQADAGEEVGHLEHWEGAQTNTVNNWPYLTGKKLYSKIFQERYKLW